MASLEKWPAIVTRASSGFGQAGARLLLQGGAKVVLAARREERLQIRMATEKKRR